jgi:hypothetical protein
MTLQLINEEALIASVPGDRERFYLETLQPYKLAGYLEYLGRRTFLSDLRVIIRTAAAIVAPIRTPPPSLEQVRAVAAALGMSAQTMNAPRQRDRSGPEVLESAEQCVRQGGQNRPEKRNSGDACGCRSTSPHERVSAVAGRPSVRHTDTGVSAGMKMLDQEEAGGSEASACPAPRIRTVLEDE